MIKETHNFLFSDLDNSCNNSFLFAALRWSFHSMPRRGATIDLTAALFLLDFFSLYSSSLSGPFLLCLQQG